MSKTITLTIPHPSARLAWLALGISVGLAGGILSNPFVGTRTAMGVDSPDVKEHTITVAGTGRVVLTPDTADLRLGVTTTAATVKDARARAASAMTAVIAALRKLGIAQRDIRTTALTLQPVYDYSNGSNPPRLTGYTFSNGVAVTLRDLDLVASAVDDALGAGATSLDGVTFRVDDEAAAERQARESAMQEAKSKADALAEAAGVRITGVASIAETSAPIAYPTYFAAGLAAARDVATPVEPGTTEVSISVSVAYLID
jgi:uncharacterized protein YggE